MNTGLRNPQGAEGRKLLAVDIGGTKVAAAVVSPAEGIIARRQAPTAQEGPAAGIRQIVSLLGELLRARDLKANDIQAVGVGIPAVLEPQTDRVIWAPNLPGWRDVPLRTSLQEHLQLPVAVEYDGHTAVLGEWWAGAGQGYDDCVDIIVGTGIGGGIILNRQLVRGCSRLAGAAGWTALTDAAGTAGERSRDVGHWESLAAGPGIARRAAGQRPNFPGSPLAAMDPATINAQDVFAAARQGDPLGLRVVEETASLLGLGIANIVSVLNPQIVILGGSIGSQGDLLLPGVRQAVDGWAQPIAAAAVTIASSSLGTDAGLLGAAYAALLRDSTPGVPGAGSQLHAGNDPAFLPGV